MKKTKFGPNQLKKDEVCFLNQSEKTIFLKSAFEKDKVWPKSAEKGLKMVEISSSKRSKRQFLKEISCFKRQNQLSKKSKISCWLPLKSLILPTVQIEIDCKWFRKNGNKVAFLQFFWPEQKLLCQPVEATTNVE